MARREFKVKWQEEPLDMEKPESMQTLHVTSMLREQLKAGGFRLDHVEPDGTSVYYTVEPPR